MSERPISNLEQRKFWNEERGYIWVSEQEKIENLVGPLGDHCIKYLDARLGETILDIGCGTGTTTLQISRLVGGAGKVTGLDLSGVMLELASKRAEKKQYKNIEFREADAQTYKFQHDSFDAIFSRFGVMFFDQPEKAFRNLYKSLKTGGRLALVCWADREENDWINVSSKIASKFVELPLPSEPRSSGPFAFEDRTYLNAILSKTGWKNISFKRYISYHSIGDSVNEAAEFLCLMGPMSGPFEKADKVTKSKCFEALRTGLKSYFCNEGVIMKFSVWIVSADKVKSN